MGMSEQQPQPERDVFDLLTAGLFCVVGFITFVSGLYYAEKYGVMGYYVPLIGVGVFVFGVTWAVRYFKGTPAKNTFKPSENWIVDETPEYENRNNDADAVRAGADKADERADGDVR
ncbi:MAG TPA: hypothetical protein PL099_01310 [Thermoclostridium caenicola]|nr:hypothetical protein [Thermoclostridium caenicola]